MLVDGRERRLLPRPRRRGRRAGASRRSRASPRTAGSIRSSRRSSTPARPVRLLHPGPARSRRTRCWRDPAPDACRDRGRARRQPVPLRRLRADHRGGPCARGRGDGRRDRRVAGPRRRPATGSPATRRTSPTSTSTGELHVKLVTVDHARARIVAIDATRRAGRAGRPRRPDRRGPARSPMPRFGPQFQDRPVIAVGETHYHGEPVAAVAAETKDAAEEAAGLVRVECEPLPAVTTIAAALAAGRAARPGPDRSGPDDPLAATNVLREHRYGWGDVDAAAAEAEVVVEGTYDFPMVTQFAIEPHAFMAAPDGDGIAIWSSIQHPYWLQRVMAGVLGLPLAKVRVFAPDPGGAFGGKQHAKYEPLVAFLALRTGRPCPARAHASRRRSRPSAAARREVHVRTGFRRDGAIVFRDIRADYLIGAYADIADRTVGKGSFTSNGPYAVPAVRIFARSVLSHTVPSTAFRGFGNPQQIWAVESNIERGGPRPRHRPGRAAAAEPRPAGAPVHPRRHAGRRRLGDVPAARRRDDRLGRAGAPGARPRDRRRPEVRARRPASRTRPSGSSPTAAPSSTRARRTWARARGRSSPRSSSEELGVPVDAITVVMGDTAVVPYDQQTSASRSTVIMGRAIQRACAEIQGQVRAMAARAASVDEADVVVERGDGPHRRPGWSELAIRDRPARRRGRRPRRAAQGRRTRSIRSAVRPPSSSSTRPPSRSRSIARPAT